MMNIDLNVKYVNDKHIFIQSLFMFTDIYNIW